MSYIVFSKKENNLTYSESGGSLKNPLDGVKNHNFLGKIVRNILSFCTGGIISRVVDFVIENRVLYLNCDSLNDWLILRDRTISKIDPNHKDIQQKIENSIKLILNIKSSDRKDGIFNDIGKSKITYEKGKEETSKIIPCHKIPIGRGAGGDIHVFKNNENYVVKKSTDSLENEFNMGKLDNPNLVKHHKLYIKKYSNGDEKHKILMDRVFGVLLSDLKKEKKEFNKEELKSLIEQIKQCCLYLYDENVVWMDLNYRNIFIEKSTIRFIDYDFWTIENDPIKRATGLFCGARELVEGFVTNLKSDTQKNIEREKKIIFPEEIFGKNLENKVTQIPKLNTHIFGLSQKELQAVEGKIQNLKNNPKEFLMNYFNAVLKNLELA